jgi:hypothetical protein
MRAELCWCSTDQSVELRILGHSWYGKNWTAVNLKFFANGIVLNNPNGETNNQNQDVQTHWWPL